MPYTDLTRDNAPKPNKGTAMTARTKEAPTAPTAPTLTFADAPVPATVRTPAPNPLGNVCKELAATMRDGRSTIAKTVTVADVDQVAKIKRWLAQASAEQGVTFRSTVDGTKVTFWAVTKIVHTRKAKAKTSDTPGTPAE